MFVTWLLTLASPIERRIGNSLIGVPCGNQPQNFDFTRGQPVIRGVGSSHPGDFIRTEIIEPAGLSVTAAAVALHVSRPALSSLLNGKADLSGDMALRIEKAFGVKMDTLMRMQASYDIAQTRKREKQIHVRRVNQLVQV